MSKNINNNNMVRSEGGDLREVAARGDDYGTCIDLKRNYGFRGYEELNKLIQTNRFVVTSKSDDCSTAASFRSDCSTVASFRSDCSTAASEGGDYLWCDEPMLNREDGCFYGYEELNKLMQTID